MAFSDPGGPTDYLNSPHATQLYTQHAVKVALYSPSSNNAQRQQREGSYVAIFWNINLTPAPSKDGIGFSWHTDYIHWQGHLWALCPVFLSGFWILPRHLNSHIQTSIVQAKIMFVCLVTQPTCTTACWHIWLRLQNLLFPKLWHTISHTHIHTHPSS